jgi:hypothetical protein
VGAIFPLNFSGGGMKAQIENIISEVEAYIDYVTEDNGDYSEGYDILLADDSAYYADQWKAAILVALDAEDITADMLDQIIEAIVSNPSGYCDVEIKRWYFWSDSLTCASFSIGELELYQQWHFNSDFIANGVARWLNNTSDFYFKAEGVNLSCYINMTDYSIAYILRPDDIKELYCYLIQCEEEV